ncbi:MAG: riboflavin synthase [Acidimicrobiales bacterium]
MFTGLVEEVGHLVSRDGHRLTVAAVVVLDGLAVGDSVAHDGCCLTVVSVDQHRGTYDVEVVDETLARTTLGGLAPGDRVNLERPVLLGGRLGGHLVQGHVDAVGQMVNPAPDLRVSLPAGLLRYVVEKGSIAVDGCSLTVVATYDDGFGVAVIPHTAWATTLGSKRPGDQVNVEVDLLAKYVEKLLGERS